MREKIYFPEDLENSGLCMRVRELESDYEELEKKLKITIETLEAIEYCIENPLTKYPEIVDYTHRVVKEVLLKLKGDQNE